MLAQRGDPLETPNGAGPQTPYSYRKDAPVLGTQHVIALHDIAASKSSSGGSSFFLIIIVVLIGGMFLLMSRSNKKRQAQASKIQNEAVPGARIMTTAGLIGTVVAVEDDEVVLEVAPDVEIHFVKQSIGRVLTPAGAGDEDDDEYEDDEYEDEDDTEDAAEDETQDTAEEESEESDEKPSRI
jgi:preprotein translocase subunit YajC